MPEFLKTCILLNHKNLNKEHSNAQNPLLSRALNAHIILIYQPTNCTNYLLIFYSIDYVIKANANLEYKIFIIFNNYE
jgi:hypothetical protein